MKAWLKACLRELENRVLGAPYVPEHYLCRSWDVLGFTVWIASSSKRLLRRLIADENLPNRTVFLGYANFAHNRATLALFPELWRTRIIEKQRPTEDAAPLLGELFSDPGNWAYAVEQAEQSGPDRGIWLNGCACAGQIVTGKDFRPLLTEALACKSEGIRMLLEQNIAELAKAEDLDFLIEHAEVRLNQLRQETASLPESERKQLDREIETILSAMRLADFWALHLMKLVADALACPETAKGADAALTFLAGKKEFTGEVEAALETVIISRLHSKQLQAHALELLAPRLSPEKRLELCIDCISDPNLVLGDQPLIAQALALLLKLGEAAKPARAALTVALLRIRNEDLVRSIKEVLNKIGVESLDDEDPPDGLLTFAA